MARALRGADITDPPTIEALVRALPDARRYDAALFYYPHGGDVRADADGGQATEAGQQLYEFYKAECGHEPGA